MVESIVDRLRSGPCSGDPCFEDAADVIEEYQAKEVLADRAHKAMTAEIEKLQRNLRHWRDECGKLHAQLTTAKDQRNEYQKLSQEANRVLVSVKKVRDGYADQARFADVDQASYFREFVRRLDAVCTAKEVQDRCWGCPPVDYPTDVTRCTECPNRIRP